MRGFLKKLLGRLPVPTPKQDPSFSGGDLLTQFLEGYTLFPETGSIHSARYLAAQQQLEITDQGLHLHSYDGIDLARAADFFNAGDKDAWLRKDYFASYRPVDLGRPVTPTDIRVTAHPAHMQSFLSGLLTLHFTSSFGPCEAKYRQDLQALGCVFKDGFVCTYTDFPVNKAEALAASTSKGKWIWAHVFDGFIPGTRKWRHKFGYKPGVWVDDL
jgi:hypothetical protein